MKKDLKKYPSYESFRYDSEEAIEYNNNKDEKLVFHFDYLDTKWKIDFNLLIDQTDKVKELVGKIKKPLSIISEEDFFNNAKILRQWRNDYSSQLIEGINKKNHDSEARRRFFEFLDGTKEYFEKIDELTIDNLAKTYKIISDNQSLANKDRNEIIDKDIKFRQKDIFINNKKSSISPDLVETKLAKFCELFNDVEQFKFINNDLITNDQDFWLNQEIVKTLYPAVIIHFCFEYIHPFPDFNGRIGRIIYDDFIRRNFKGLEEFGNIFMSSEAINASKQKYYHAINQTENGKDLTYMLIYYHDIIITNLAFLGFERKNQAKLNDLNEYQKLILFNIFTTKTQISASEYMKQFNYDKSKQQLHNDLNKLDELDLLDYQEHKNRIRRYYIKK